MPEINLENRQRAERKLLIHVAEWKEKQLVDDPDHPGQQIEQEVTKREILGTRTPDSSIEFNIDSETSTDIRGITYADVNKTEPTQTFDPYTILGGSPLGAYLSKAALKNDITAYNGIFDLYIITAYMGQAGAYYAVKHTGCSIFPTAIGGESYVNMPIEVHYSNDIKEGTVDKLTDDFVFTETVTVNP